MVVNFCGRIVNIKVVFLSSNKSNKVKDDKFEKVINSFKIKVCLKYKFVFK